MIFRVQKKITSESKYKSQKTFTTLILGVKQKTNEMQLCYK